MSIIWPIIITLVTQLRTDPLFGRPATQFLVLPLEIVGLIMSVDSHHSHLSMVASPIVAMTSGEACVWRVITYRKFRPSLDFGDSGGMDKGQWTAGQ